jgi:hypothetical protein
MAALGSLVVITTILVYPFESTTVPAWKVRVLMKLGSQGKV